MAGTKDAIFELFELGKRPSDPEVEKLGLKKRTNIRYFQEFKKNHDGEVPNPEKPRAAPAIGSPKGSLGESVKMTIIPKAFTTSSYMIWQAIQAAIEVWGWPADIEPGKFLDIYLYVSFKQRGITLGGYTVTRIEEGGNDGDE